MRIILKVAIATIILLVFNESASALGNNSIEDYITTNTLMTAAEAPSTPPTPSVSKYCGYSRAYRATPPSGVTYYWQTSSSGTSTSNSGSYYQRTSSGYAYLRAYNGQWSAARSVYLSVKYNPSTPNASDKSRCGTGGLTLTASPVTSGSYIYWYDGSTLKSYNETSYNTPSLSSTKTYTVKAYKDGCYSSGRSVNAIIKAKPNANAGADKSICSGQSTTLSASGGGSYSWSPTAGLSSSTSASTTASPNESMTYTVTVTASNGCTDTDAATVTVRATPSNPTISTLSTPNEFNKTQTMRVTGESGATFKWYNSSKSYITTATTYNPNNSSNGVTYYARAYKNNCYSGYTSKQTVIYKVPPQPGTISSTQYCGYTKLYKPTTVSGSVLYWQTTSGGTSTANSSSSWNVTSSGTYYIRAYAYGYWSTARAVSVSVKYAPSNPTASDKSRCGAGGLTLTASPVTSGSYIYWYDGSTLKSYNETSYNTPSLSSTKTYTVKAYKSGCYSSGKSVNAIIKTKPNANAGADKSICSGQSTTLSASGGGSYSWSPTVGLSSSTSASTTASPNESMTYTVTVTASNGCTDTDAATVTVNAIPSNPTASDKSRCGNGTVTLSATPVTSGSTIQWFDGGTLKSSNENFTTPSLSASKVYTAKATMNGCASSGKNITAIIYTPPTANAGTDTYVCAGESTTLSASGGSSYSWSPTSTLASPNEQSTLATPNETTTYTVTATASNGCTDTDQVTITHRTRPGVTAGSDKNICPSGSVQLSAGGATTYSWSPTTALTTPNAQSTTATPNETMTYTVTGSDGYCTNTDQVVVYARSNPTVSISASDNPICYGFGTVLTASGASTYSWAPTSTLSAPNEATTTATPTTGTTYTVTATSIYGCVNRESYAVTVNSLPNAYAGEDAEICAGDNTTLSASGGLSYLWSSSSTLQNANESSTLATPTESTSYTVTVTDMNGCVNTDNVYITVHELPDITATSDDSDVCPGVGTILRASGGTSYSWNNSSSLNNPYIATPLATPNEEGSITYTVTGTDANSCENTASVALNVKERPDITVSSNKSICPGSSTMLSVSGAETYAWLPSSTLNDPNEASPTASPTSNTTYTVTATGSNGCTNTGQVTVSMKETPATPVIDQLANSCGNSATPFRLTSNTSGSTISWYVNNTLKATNETSPNLTMEAASNSVKVVLKNNTTQCEASNSISVINYERPTAPAADGVSVDDPGIQTLTYDPIPGLTLKWYDANTGSLLHTGSSFQTSISETTTYNTTVSDAHCESAQSTYQVTIVFPDGRVLYAIDDGDWSSATTWSNLPNGTSIGRIPEDNIDVYINGKQVTVTSVSESGTITLTDEAGTLTRLDVNEQNLTVHGQVKLNNTNQTNLVQLNINQEGNLQCVEP